MNPSMHVIDYTIRGDDMQFVEIELDPGEEGSILGGLGRVLDGDNS